MALLVIKDYILNLNDKNELELIQTNIKIVLSFLKIKIHILTSIKECLDYFTHKHRIDFLLKTAQEIKTWCLMNLVNDFDFIKEKLAIISNTKDTTCDLIQIKTMEDIFTIDTLLYLKSKVNNYYLKLANSFTPTNVLSIPRSERTKLFISCKKNILIINFDLETFRNVFSNSYFNETELAIIILNIYNDWFNLKFVSMPKMHKNRNRLFTPILKAKIRKILTEFNIEDLHKILVDLIIP